MVRRPCFRQGQRRIFFLDKLRRFPRDWHGVCVRHRSITIRLLPRLASVCATWHNVFMDIGQFIVKTPGTCGGRARLAGKRIPVSSIYRWFVQGSAPEDILNKFDGASLSEIYAAISYSLANPAEITREMESEDRLVSQAISAAGIQAVAPK
jgi:uncharacterized protein (DUF433 family)